MLTLIKKENLFDFSGEQFEEFGFLDRVSVTLTVSDYDWMQYVIEIMVPFKDNPISLNIEYYGTISSNAECHNLKTGDIIFKTSAFPSDIILDEMMRYQMTHIQYIKDTIDQINDVSLHNISCRVYNNLAEEINRLMLSTSGQ